MTVAGTYAPSIYTGNGTTTAFTANWQFTTPADVQAYVWDTANLVFVSSVFGGTNTYDYTVTGTPNSVTGEYPAGTVTFNTAPLGTYRVILTRAIVATQGLSLTNTGPLAAVNIMVALDKLMLLAQQLQADVQNCLQVPVQDAAPTALPSAATRAGYLLGFDTNGNPSTYAALPTGSAYSVALDAVLTAASPAAASAALGPPQAVAAGGFYTNYSPAAKIAYLGDRAFVGAASAANGWSGSFPSTDTSWLAAAFPGFGVSEQATFGAIDQYSQAAVVGATRSVTGPLPSGAGQDPIAIVGLASNQSTSSSTPGVWGGYFDARRASSSVVTGTVGIEIDTANLGAAVTTTPYAYEPSTGYTSNLWLAAGSGLTSGLSPSSAAITILPNGAKFQAGIVFAFNALTTTGLLSTAVAMATGQCLAWYANGAGGGAGGNITSSIATSANSQNLQFNDYGLTVSNSAAAHPTLQVTSSGSAEANGILIAGSASGGVPVIAAFGNGGSGAVNLYVAGQSTGNVLVETNLLPSIDNAASLGISGFRWSSVWAANGTIQTSDPTLKTDIADLPAALPIVAAITPKTYRWLTGGHDVTIETVDGRDRPKYTPRPGRRTHWGFLASDIKAATPPGMDWAAYVRDEDGMEHMRMDQMMPVLWKAVQELSAELAALKAAATPPHGA